MLFNEVYTTSLNEQQFHNLNHIGKRGVALIFFNPINNNFDLFLVYEIYTNDKQTFLYQIANHFAKILTQMLLINIFIKKGAWQLYRPEKYPRRGVKICTLVNSFNLTPKLTISAKKSILTLKSYGNTQQSTLEVIKIINR